MKHESNQHSPTGGDSLARQVGVLGATMMGLGSILGTGIFVSIAVAAEASGPAVLLAIAVAAVVATCNALSSAQLAANHPLSGGTYEYGYRWLTPALGFLAGWMFLCAKSASAATAALGFSGYTLRLLGQSSTSLTITVAIIAAMAVTLLVLSGLRRTNTANILIVSITVLSLAVFVLAGIPMAVEGGEENLSPFFLPPQAGSSPLSGLLEACALMFVAYTGYGRIATLGEEIHDPRRNIPLAIITTLFVSTALYLLVGLIAIASAGSDLLATAINGPAAPLEVVARAFQLPGVAVVVSVGAICAMLGVLLNLVLGLSRVLFAMARRGDMPGVFSRVRQSTPLPAVIAMGVVIALLTLLGSVKTTWSFSAFTVLVYYAVTNLSAIRLSPSERLYPRFIPWLGLFYCLFLAFWVEPAVWMTGLGVIVVGFVVRFVARRVSKRNP